LAQHRPVPIKYEEKWKIAVKSDERDDETEDVMKNRYRSR
jgi:hypothetical protein